MPSAPSWPPPSIATAPARRTSHVALVTLATSSTVVTNADFGYNWSGSIGDFVWWDYNTNGLQDGGLEVGIPNARVQLYFDADFDGVLDRILGDYEILRVFTNASGNYLIPNLPPGNYFVDVYEDSLTTGGIRNVVPTTDDLVPVNLTPVNKNVTTADFGYFVGARVEALIFWDANHDGFRGPEEQLLTGITVTLTGTDKQGVPITPLTALSDATGNVVFLVPEGDYTISYSLADRDSLYPALDTQTTPISFDFEAKAGEDGVRFFEFGVDNAGIIGDTIFADVDGGGSQGPGEPGLADVTVNLYIDLDGDGIIDAEDTLLDFTVTDATGNYSFIGLADITGAQRYLVQVLTETLPSVYASTPTAFPSGANTAESIYTTTLTGGQTINIVDFGYRINTQVTAVQTISGTIYNDNGATGGTASDGILNGAEPGIGSIQLEIVVDPPGAGTPPVTYLVSTGSNGFYTLGGIQQNSDVTIRVLDAPLLNNAFVQTGDPNGGTLSNQWQITGINTNVSDLNFGYLQDLGSIGGTVVLGDGDGIAEVGEPRFGSSSTYPVVTVTLRAAGPDGILGTVDDGISTTTTNSTGVYSFINLLPGPYEITTAIPAGFFELADRDGFNKNSINVTLATGQDVVGRDFEYQQSSLAGTVRIDTNGNGSFDSGEPSIPNVTVFLDLDNNGVLNGVEPTTTTAANGTYSFGPIPSGTYAVRINPTTLSSSLMASYDPDGITSLHLATVVVGINQNITGVDFGYYEAASLGNQVWFDANGDGLLNNGETGIPGIPVQLFRAGDNPLTATPVATTNTAGGGLYLFGGLKPGGYFVYLPVPPADYPGISTVNSTTDNQVDNDNNGIQPVFGGPVSSPVITLISGQNNNTLDFGFTCHATWEEWQFFNPLGGQNDPAQNPDTDRYPNLLKFAFALDPETGVGTAFRIRPYSGSDPLFIGTLEAVFIRPKNADQDVTYWFEHAATIGNPTTTWTPLGIDAPFSGVNPVITPLNICFEEVIIRDVERFTGDEGVIRIVAEFETVDFPTEVEGWKETGFGIACQTYNNPYLLQTEFTGTVSGVTGLSLTFIGEDFGFLAPGVAYFLEVTSGDNEGHRFDIASATGNTLTIATDAALHGATAPFNTRVTDPTENPLPANLASDTVVIRRHRTLNQLFPPASFGATTDKLTADEIQIFSCGAWELLWLRDTDGIGPAEPAWLTSADAAAGDTVIPPGQGLFFNNREAKPASQPGTSVLLLSYGEVRENDFIRPLAQWNNHVGGGYPIDQSPAGRAMGLAAGFIGTRDFKTADSIFLWNPDKTPPTLGYDGYYFLASISRSSTG